MHSAESPPVMRKPTHLTTTENRTFITIFGDTRPLKPL